jgi:hypothetical protein
MHLSYPAFPHLLLLAAFHPQSILILPCVDSLLICSQERSLISFCERHSVDPLISPRRCTSSFPSASGTQLILSSLHADALPHLLHVPTGCPQGPGTLGSAPQPGPGEDQYGHWALYVGVAVVMSYRRNRWPQAETGERHLENEMKALRLQILFWL